MKMKVFSLLFVAAFSLTISVGPVHADQCDDMRESIEELEDDIQDLRNSLGPLFVELILALGPPVNPFIVEIIADIEATFNLMDELARDIIIIELGMERIGCEP